MAIINFIVSFIVGASWLYFIIFAFLSVVAPDIAKKMIDYNRKN